MPAEQVPKLVSQRFERGGGRSNPMNELIGDLNESDREKNASFRHFVFHCLLEYFICSLRVCFKILRYVTNFHDFVPRFCADRTSG